MRAQPAPGEEQGRDEARPQRIGTHLRSSLTVSLRLLRRLARRSTGPGRRARPGLGHALGQLARIGAVARPAPAGLATALHLALAGLGHALGQLARIGAVARPAPAGLATALHLALAGLGHALGQLARIGAVARPAPAGLATALHLALAGLGHALGQLARIGAVARPAPAGLATALHLALAGLGHARRDLLLAGPVLLALRHGTLLYPEGRARRSGPYPPPLAALLLRRPRGRGDRAAPAGPDAADPGRPGCRGGGRWRLVERPGLGRDVVPRHRLDILLGHVLGDDAGLRPDLDPVEVERHVLGAEAEEAAARDHEALDLAARGVDDRVLDLAERLAVRTLDGA